MVARKNIEAVNSEAQNPLDKEREDMHRKMFSAVSHDLKTPLASMIGSLEIYERMKDKLSPQKQSALIGMALQEAYRLDNFVTNILDMAKLESGMVVAGKETINLRSMINDCLTNLENRLKDCNVQISARTEAGLITTDPALLCRALSLIIDNAVKYGGQPAVIQIEYGQKTSGYYYIQVHDNGAGVPEPRKMDIFAKYTRFARRDLQNAGTGLGLPICREIMRLLGGSVEAANHVQGGAIFTLAFPCE